MSGSESDISPVPEAIVTDFLYGYPVHDVTRDFFFTVSDRFGIFPWIFLGLCVAAFTVFIVTLLARLSVWRKGLKDDKPRFEWGHVSVVFREIVFHKRTLREMNGIIDAAVFYGLAGLSVLYAFVLAQEYITVPAFGLRFIVGHYYLVFTLFEDIFSLIALAGVSAALIRRLALKPSSVVTGRNERIAFSLALFFLVSGFFLNALRIAVSGSPDFEVWAPFSFVLSKVFSSFSEDILTPVQVAFWFLHALSGLLIAAAGASFFFRRLTVSFLNVYACPPECREPDNKYMAHLSGVKRITRITDFRAKQLMDLDACTGCGRCQDACPAFLAGKPLSPKKLINDLSRCLDEHTDKKNPKEGIVVDYVKNDGYWSCAMCGACSESCPSMINHMQKIIELRKSSGAVPEGFARTLSMIETSGTTAENTDFRGSWYAGIDGVAPLSESGNTDVVYFAGCGVADESGKKSARAFLTLLRNAGVSVGVFGAEETCCGDAVLRAGNEQLFRKLAVKNLELFARYKVKRIVTSCPHGYNVLNKEYRSLAGELGMSCSYTVEHSTRTLCELMEKGKLAVKPDLRFPVTYHDPCFLGRYNDSYHDPRKLLQNSGAIMIEMPRSKRDGLCCGGHLEWNGSEADGLAEFRARDIYSTGARTAVTACPHCVKMLRKGLSMIGAQSVRVCDIAEFLAGGD